MALDDLADRILDREARGKQNGYTGMNYATRLELTVEDANSTITPEPGPLLLVGTGLVLTVLIRRRTMA